MDTKVLLAGATGYLGRFMIKALKEKGYWVRALARKRESLGELADLVDEVYVGNACHPLQIEHVCDGIDIVFSSLGITHQKDGLTYQQVDYQANKNVLDLAVAQNVRTFIYVSVLNADKVPNLEIIKAKERFVAALKQSPIDYLVIRPNGFFSDMAEFYRMAVKGKIYLFGKGTFKANPIYGGDLANACVDSFELVNREIAIGGPEVLTQNNIADILKEVLQAKIKVRYLPLWLAKLVKRLVRTFTSVKTYGPIEFFLTVLGMDMVAPTHGHYSLKQFYRDLHRKTGTGAF